MTCLNPHSPPGAARISSRIASTLVGLSLLLASPLLGCSKENKAIEGTASAAAPLKPAPAPGAPRALAVSDTTVTVGQLHSATGTMAISETGSIQAERLAIDQINASGGILGRKIEII